MSAKFRQLLVFTMALGVLCATGFVLAAQTEDSAAQANPEEPPRPDAKEIRNNHGITTDCVQCHGDQPESIVPDTMTLVTAVPQLCSTCHEAYAFLDGWVHGPAATGDCLFCHDPHESEHGSLLTKPLPGLCHECHTRETLTLIAGHSDESYSRCDTCHESHAGTNRKLLKQSFLKSTKGTASADEATARRRPYTLVDRRGSLTGLDAIRVIPTIERQDLIGRYGLTPEIVKKDVERRLREKGIRILSEAEPATGQRGLHVLLRLVELRFPGYSNEVCALSGSLDLSLRQTVELVAQPNDAERRICLASTWDTSAVIVWGLPQIQEGLDQAVAVLADRFCSDFLQANPSTAQATSDRDMARNPMDPTAR